MTILSPTHPSSSIAKPSLIADKISKSFTSGLVSIQILSNLSLAILPNELTLISGPSGCGKSTLLSILSGLQHPDQGKTWALDQELSRSTKRELEYFRLHHTGFIFQGFNLFPALTACEQIELPLGYLGLTPAQCRARALEALHEVGLGHRVHQRPSALSGGEKQRVAIARALAKQPKFLFADEPTSALDAASGQVVINILRRIAHQRGATVLCVSHDHRLIQHADRILEMEDGAIHRDWRTVDQLQNHSSSTPMPDWSL
ncbi:ABC transporter ATP-binding protein [Aquirhabdus parva]|uniref:ABC transporter ATP-binding protein n=1 Tax=Aquirhabdus parva TaxID=2283318 RepID=A0A345P550_9GAMM|nr:ABC transporter ATP-binding protein [Aquirhabdus parva]AXI02409.1 ABC transporter ATP-binding protein [Aquirhabdus parva]